MTTKPKSTHTMRKIIGVHKPKDETGLYHVRFDNPHGEPSESYMTKEAYAIAVIEDRFARTLRSKFIKMIEHYAHAIRELDRHEKLKESNNQGEKQ